MEIFQNEVVVLLVIPVLLSMPIPVLPAVLTTANTKLLQQVPVQLPVLHFLLSDHLNVTTRARMTEEIRR